MAAARDTDTLPSTPKKAARARAAGASHALCYIGCADRPADDLARLFWLGDAREVNIGRGDAVTADGIDEGIALGVPDERVSRRHARLVRDRNVYSIVDAGTTNGTWVNGRRSERQTLKPGDIIETGHSFWRFIRYAPAKPALMPVETSFPLGPTRTICPALLEQLARLQLAATGKLPVLILGETGAGKEVVAWQVHAWSGRGGPLGAISCAEIPGSLLERELFGHRKGAFTDAVEDRAGRIEAADRGSLLLDEIGDLKEEAQVKLLRVLQDGHITRLGDTRPRKVDVRFIAATHRDLHARVREGRFRDDLYGRLRGFTLHLPPLRERLEDLGILLAYQLRSLGAPDGLRVDVELMRRLLQHRWRFNVREMEHAVELTLLLARGGPKLRLEDAEPALLQAEEAAAPAAWRPERIADQDLRPRLLEALGAREWNISAVARDLGKSRWQILRWMKRLDLHAPPEPPA